MRSYPLLHQGEVRRPNNSPEPTRPAGWLSCQGTSLERVGPAISGGPNSRSDWFYLAILCRIVWKCPFPDSLEET